MRGARSGGNLGYGPDYWNGGGINPADIGPKLEQALRSLGMWPPGGGGGLEPPPQIPPDMGGPPLALALALDPRVLQVLGQPKK
jgi:hypothetical protein